MAQIEAQDVIQGVAGGTRGAGRRGGGTPPMPNLLFPILDRKGIE